jgi:hypothetical protein
MDQETTKALGLREGMERGREQLRKCRQRRMELGTRYRAVVGQRRRVEAVLRTGLTTEEINLIATVGSLPFEKVEALSNLVLRKVADALR